MNQAIKILLFSLLPFMLWASPSPAKIVSGLQYCKKAKLNTEYAIFVDMSKHSGKRRLYLYSFTKQKVLLSGLCSHGCGNAPWGEDKTKTAPVFSNTPESHCSSLGKYRIGKRGISSWGIGINYKLHGLENSNSNAFKRIIVLHSWNAIENFEPYPLGTPEGWGCPSVSNAVMKKLDTLLQTQKKPVLLWIYK